MTFRNLETLQSWISDFDKLGYSITGAARVIVQDGEDGANTGLVGVHLENASTTVYIQPESVDSAHWVATMEPRDTAVLLDSAGLLALSSELAALSALCAYLQTRSRDYTGTDDA